MLLEQSNDEAKKQCILLVEDNHIAQMIAKTLLTQMNYSVDIAENGLKAINLCKLNNYDLIFMDIGLPDMDGYQTSHLIRMQELSKKVHVPIIALTAHAADEDKKKCIDAGMNAVYSKPLTKEQCIEIVTQYIPENKLSKTRSSSIKELPNEEQELFAIIQYPILDEAQGLKMTGTKEIFKEMLQLLIETLPQDAVCMKEAKKHNDWDKAQHFAHKIKAGAVYLGTLRLQYACQYFERYYKSGQHELLEPLYQQAMRVIKETLVYIDEWLRTTRNENG